MLISNAYIILSSRISQTEGALDDNIGRTNDDVIYVYTVATAWPVEIVKSLVRKRGIDVAKYFKPHSVRMVCGPISVTMIMIAISPGLQNRRSRIVGAPANAFGKGKSESAHAKTINQPLTRLGAP